MNSMKNKVNLIGNLGFNPEIKMLENGKKMARVTIATNEKYHNAKGEKVTDTQWHQIVAFGKQAEIMERFTKVGTKIALEGKLVSRSYTDKNGLKKYITEVELKDLLVLSNFTEELIENEKSE